MMDDITTDEKRRQASIACGPNLADMFLFGPFYYGRKQAYARALREGYLIQNTTFREWEMRMDHGRIQG